MSRRERRASARAAPAKINLYLHVVGRRPQDGLHLLDSAFLFTALADRISAVPAPRFSLSVKGPWAGEIENVEAESNLALKAARRLACAAGVTSAAKITLEKRIPVAAGLGGGSADAAAALKACAELWGLDEYAVDLPSLALELGADVPACLESRSLHAGGVGERLSPLGGSSPPWSVLLVNPRLDLPTKDVFAAYARSRAPFSAPAEMSHWRCTDWLERNTRNDLETAATELAPAVAELLDALRGLPALRLARMSGSGATCFGLFDNADDAARASEILRARYPDWWIWAGEFVR